MSETDIPIPGTLDDLGLEELIDYDLYRDRTPFSNPDHPPSNFSNFNQFEPPWLWFVRTCTWPQFPKVIVDSVESVNASAPENYSCERSPGCGEVLNEIQVSDLYSGAPQNAPELVNEGAIEAPVQIVHRPETVDNTLKSNPRGTGVRGSRGKQKSIARKWGLDQVNLSPCPRKECWFNCSTSDCEGDYLPRRHGEGTRYGVGVWRPAKSEGSF